MPPRLPRGAGDAPCAPAAICAAPGRQHLPLPPVLPPAPAPPTDVPVVRRPSTPLSRARISCFSALSLSPPSPSPASPPQTSPGPPAHHSHKNKVAQPQTLVKCAHPQPQEQGNKAAQPQTFVSVPTPSHKMKAAQPKTQSNVPHSQPQKQGSSTKTSSQTCPLTATKIRQHNPTPKSTQPSQILHFWQVVRATR